jgi:hypothetical protein
MAGAGTFVAGRYMFRDGFEITIADTVTYPSRTLQNYKNTLWGGRRFAWMFGTTQRDWALMTTNDRRKERRRLSRERWNERRHLLAGHQASTGSSRTAFPIYQC